MLSRTSINEGYDEVDSEYHEVDDDFGIRDIQDSCPPCMMDTSPDQKESKGVEHKQHVDGKVPIDLIDLEDLPVVYQHLRESECRYKTDHKYMDSLQTDITHEMRSTLIDWLVELALEYNQTQQTLFLSIQYVDRFLGLVNVNRKKLQLVGIGCFLIASKCEEKAAVTLDQLLYLSDDAYERKDLLSVESMILDKLDWSLCGPTAWEMLGILVQSINSDQHQPTLLSSSSSSNHYDVATTLVLCGTSLSSSLSSPSSSSSSSSSSLSSLSSLSLSLSTETKPTPLRIDALTAMMAKYLCELLLHDPMFLVYLPSIVAASSLYLAAMTLISTMTQSRVMIFEQSCGYSIQDLMPCVRDLSRIQAKAFDTFTNPPETKSDRLLNFPSTPRKYSNAETYFGVSQLKPIKLK